MGTTAELDRRTVADHAHLFAVFLTEQSHSAHCFGFGDRNTPVFVESDGFAYFQVGNPFYLAQFLLRYLLEMGEVETQRFGRNVRTFLFDMCSQYFP